MAANKSNIYNFVKDMISRNKFFEEENKKLIIAPLQIMASLIVIAGSFALMFEVTYFHEFAFSVYFGRLAAALIGFIILTLTYFEVGKKNPVLLVHILLLTIISSFASVIYQIPQTLYVNSHLLALIIFTSALFLSWDLRNQIIVAIYYNIIFAASVLSSDTSIYFLPSMFASVIFVMVISLISIIASAINFKMRQKTIEKSLEASEIFENAAEGIFKVNLNGILTTINPAFLEIFDYNNAHKIVGRISLSELFTSDETYTELSSKLLKELKIKNFEAECKTQSMRIIIVQINAWVVDDISGKISHFAGSIQDITEQKLASEKIKHYNEELLNLNNAKDKFFSIVAHDLISPFTALLGYSELLSTDVKELEIDQIEEFANNIHSVAKKSHHLLESLLEWSRVQSGRIPFDPKVFKIFNIAENVTHLYAESSSRKQIILMNQVNENHDVFADYNMIYTALRNLISNAIKFTPENGKIILSSREIPGFIQICVQDNGVGLTESDISKLFKIEIHHTQVGTAKEKGSGLGLILTKEFINKNGGSIYVESTPGEGSSFVFTLPKPE